MALDPVIAGGFRGIELQNPLEAYGRVAQLQNLQQQNALAALQMQKAQRDIEVENRLAQLYQRPGVEPTSPEFMREVYAISPLKGAAFQKSALETQKAQREAEAAAEKLAADRIAGARALLPAVTADSWGAWRADTLRKLPGLAGMIPETYSDEAKLRLLQSADQFLAERREAEKPLIVPRGASVLPRGATAPTFIAPDKPAADLEVMEALGFPRTQAGFAAYQASKRQPAPSTTVVVPPQEKAEQGERGKLLVKQYGAISDAAKLATRTLPALETQSKILDRGFSTGFGTDAKAAGASVLAALGVSEAEKFATNAQTFLAATQQAVLQRQLEQKGPQTESDAQRISQTAAQRGNTVDANKFLIDVARSQLKRDIAQRNFYDRWWKENKTYDGAEDAWYAGEGGKSLFESPELKAYALKAPSVAPAKPSSVRNQADAILSRERK